MIRNFLFATLSIILFLASCKDVSVNPDANYHSLKITVVDENNNPVEGVSFHYIYKFSDILEKPNNPCPATQIFYSLPSDTIDIKQYVLDYFSRDTCAKLLNNKDSAARSDFKAQLNTLTNGIYEYFLCTKDTTTRGRFFVLYLTANELILTKSKFKSDKAGEININQVNFGIGSRIAATGPDSPEIIGYREITNDIEIILYKEGYRYSGAYVTIDKSSDQSMTVKLKK